MEDKWRYVAGFALAGQHFSIWVQAIRRGDGTYDMATKSEETTKEQMNKDAIEHGIEYTAKY
jgi:hypothetical protein